jgi:hypothetical protein
LACGSDLLIATVALELKIPVVVYLPCAIERFVESSVICGGAAEVACFWSILPQIHELHVLPPALVSDLTTGYLKTSEFAGDTYVGINAAACARWVGNLPRSQQIAEQIIKRLTRVSRHWTRSADQTVVWDFWSLATMSEALWLTGQHEQAAAWEARAIALGTENGSPVEIFAGQMQRHRDHLRPR